MLDNNNNKNNNYLNQNDNYESEKNINNYPHNEFNNQYSSNYSNYQNQTPNYQYIIKEPKKTSPKKKIIGFAAIVIALCFVFSFAGTMIGNYLSPQNSQINTQQPTNPQSFSGIIPTTSSSGSNLTIEQVAEIGSKSVVEITTESITTANRMQQYVSTGAGSGVIISEDGYIVTNDHVIEDSTKITVTLKDGKQYPATLVGTDPKTDIAVIKINEKSLTPATFGSSSYLKVGQEAIAIGNPLGQLGGTVTNGIISALDREIIIDGKVMNLLQTNAAINPGNSGGGLFNIKGELVGVVNSKSSGSDVEGLGFAIPVDTAKTIIENLIEFGYVQGRVELGISLVDIQDTLSAMMYRVSGTGVYIMSVEDNSSAKLAGLLSGDRIISIDDIKIETSTDITTILDKHSVGDEIKIGIERNGKKGTTTITLQEHKEGSSL